MICCALPCSNLSPTLQNRIARIANLHGFMSFPQFLDNNFKTTVGKADIKFIDAKLRQYGCGLVQFAVAPDYEYKKMVEFKNKYPKINWIYPLHSRFEDFNSFQWVGMPQNPALRDYDLATFLKLTKTKKTWLLGFYLQTNPEHLLKFDGFDTTLPFIHSNNGELWRGWGKTTPNNRMLTLEELQSYNVLNLKISLLNLFASNCEQERLEMFCEVEN